MSPLPSPGRYPVAAALVVLALFLVAVPAAAVVTPDNGIDELSMWAAAVLGLVEGATEYLPVSSTGHLLVTTELLGLAQTEEAERALDTYAICIQAGAILAVIVLYRERLRQMADGLLGRDETGRRVLVGVVAAFVPTAVIGLVLVRLVREYLFGIGPVAAAWLVGGLAILGLTRTGLLTAGRIELDRITVRHALLIGLAQSVALWPGVSRSLVTIVAGTLVGLTLRAAVEFAFLLGLVTLGAATVVTAAADGEQLIELYGWAAPTVGLVVAFLAALASIRWMVSWLQDRSLDVFGWYRVVVGVLALAALGAGWL